MVSVQRCASSTVPTVISAFPRALLARMLRDCWVGSGATEGVRTRSAHTRQTDRQPSLQRLRIILCMTPAVSCAKSTDTPSSRAIDRRQVLGLPPCKMPSKIELACALRCEALPVLRLSEKALVGRRPLPQTTDARLNGHVGLPAHVTAGLCDIADVARLVTGAPFATTDADAFAVQPGQKFAKLLPDGQRIDNPSTNVVNVARRCTDLIYCQT